MSGYVLPTSRDRSRPQHDNELHRSRELTALRKATQVRTIGHATGRALSQYQLLEKIDQEYSPPVEAIPLNAGGDLLPRDWSKKNLIHAGNEVRVQQDGP